MDNYLFKKYQEKADNQLLLIKERKLKLKKNFYLLYFTYLNRLRSEIPNFIKKAISSLKEVSNNDINLNKKEIRSLIINEINPLINERMPFITIEQLTLTKFSHRNNSLKEDQIPKKNFDLEAKCLNKKDNKNYSLNIFNECEYYKFSEEYELKASIDLDDFNYKNEIFYDYRNLTYNSSKELFNNEKLVSESVIDFKLLENDEFNYKIMKTSNEELNLLNWSEWLDFSLSYQLKKISSEVNNILFMKKIIKKNITEEFLDYISDNDFLITNPFSFVNLFDLNNKEIINSNNFVENLDISKIYFFNLNITEIEYCDMNLNTIRNNINDLKYKFNLLIKKEKYWNNKKLYTKRNKSTITKL